MKCGLRSITFIGHGLVILKLEINLGKYSFILQLIKRSSISYNSSCVVWYRAFDTGATLRTRSIVTFIGWSGGNPKNIFWKDIREVLHYRVHMLVPTFHLYFYIITNYAWHPSFLNSLAIFIVDITCMCTLIFASSKVRCKSSNLKVNFSSYTLDCNFFFSCSTGHPQSDINTLHSNHKEFDM